MKNNKGFTLIELIVTIGIMILIGLVIANNMSGILSKEHDEEYKRFKSQIEDSACIYIEIQPNESNYSKNKCRNNGGCTISINDLIEAGLIEDNLKDPSTGNVIDKNRTVSVNWVDNIKTCEMNGE